MHQPITIDRSEPFLHVTFCPFLTSAAYESTQRQYHSLSIAIQSDRYIQGIWSAHLQSYIARIIMKLYHKSSDLIIAKRSLSDRSFDQLFVYLHIFWGSLTPNWGSRLHCIGLWFIDGRRVEKTCKIARTRVTIFQMQRLIDKNKEYNKWWICRTHDRLEIKFCTKDYARSRIRYVIWS